MGVAGLVDDVDFRGVDIIEADDVVGCLPADCYYAGGVAGRLAIFEVVDFSVEGFVVVGQAAVDDIMDCDDRWYSCATDVEWDFVGEAVVYVDFVAREVRSQATGDAPERGGWSPNGGRETESGAGVGEEGHYQGGITEGGGVEVESPGGV